MAEEQAKEPSAEEQDGLDLVRFWKKEVQGYERDALDWQGRARNLMRRYTDRRNDRESTKSRFNILWSNTQTLLPALRFKNPKPDISRRFNDADPVGRVAADVLERATGYCVGCDDYGMAMRQAVFDYVLPGRGTIWVRYVPHMRDLEVKGPPEVEDEGAEISDDVESADQDEQPPPQQYVAYEEVVVDFVHREDFGHSPDARTWQEVRGVWRAVYLEREELVERFGEPGRTVPLDHKQKDLSGRIIEEGAKATIYEIWDKKRRQALWMHKDVAKPLDLREDPLKVEGFFPCPRPLFANLTNDGLIPTPDYVQYQDQAIQLDELTARIALLVKALKVAGVYDASAEGVQRVLAEGVENKLVPVDQWAIHAEKGGLAGVMDFLPIDKIAGALIAAYNARDKVKAEIYELTGIADIIRGATAPEETATAQQIKGNFATLRLSDRQAEVQRFERDTIRLIGEVIACHFSIDTIKLVSGVRLLTDQQKALLQQLFQLGMPVQLPDLRPDELDDLMDQPTWEQVEQLLRDEPGRRFRIDIETDSTIKEDQESEKEQRIEFLKAAGGFLQQAVVAGQQQPELVPLLAQMLMFGIRAFPVGKQLEQSFSTMLTKLEKKAAQPPTPKPDPEMAKLTQEGQLRQAEMQQDAQLETLKAHLNAGLEQQKLEMQAQLDQHRNAVEAQRTALQQQSDAAMERMGAEFKAMTAALVAHINNVGKIEVARVTAGADPAGGATVIAAEQQQEQGPTP